MKYLIEFVQSTLSPADCAWLSEQIDEGVRDDRHHAIVLDLVCGGGGYLLAAAATEVVIAPGGRCGGVGVFAFPRGGTPADGVIARAGERKGHFWPAAEGLPSWFVRDTQAWVDALHERMIAALARYRGVTEAHVRQHFGAGDMLDADAALAARMVDRIESLPYLESGRPVPDFSPEGQIAALRSMGR
jgi:ClpP class serine protease